MKSLELNYFFPIFYSVVFVIDSFCLFPFPLVPPLFVIEFLHRVVDIFTEYFNSCTESSIKDHIVVVFEVRDKGGKIFP